MSSVANLPYVDTSDADFVRDPFDILRELRSQSWLAATQEGFLLLSFESVQGMFLDQRFHEGGPQIARALGLEGEAYTTRVSDMLFTDGEDHARTRRIVSKFFTPLTMDRYRARLNELLDEHLTRMEQAGGGEVIADLALAVPSKLFCEVLGVPVADAGFLAEVTESTLKTFLLDPDDAEEIGASMASLKNYLAELAEEKLRRPGEDLMSLLVHARESGAIDHEGMLHLAMSIVEGSSDNTTNSLAIALLAFDAHPGEWERLVADPGLAGTAAEECLRYLPRVRAQAKICDEPTEFMGMTFPADTWIYQSLESANRDETVFDDPDEFRIDRVGARQLAFGTGRHICLGAPLARMELGQTLSTLAGRWKSFRTDGEPTLLLDSNIRGVVEMPILIEPAH